jgi:lysophospholipase L1-like esterase
MIITGSLMLAVVGCSTDGSPSRAEASNPTSTSVASTTTTPSIGSTLQPGDRYVALGSSIASGFGISVQSASCGRSNRNYPNLIAARFALKLVDVTCGAATIPNVLDTAQGAAPPQINAVTRETKLVTVTVGGNDIIYNGVAVACGDPTNVCTAPPGLDASVASTRTALKTLIDRIKAAAPDATIVFVTYPREVPADKNCPELSYTDGEAAIVRSMGEQLEALFVEVVEPTGVVFVDPYVATGDHTGCAPAAERWTAGHVPDDGFAYHPTALGHEVMATMIAKALGD